MAKDGKDVKDAVTVEWNLEGYDAEKAETKTFTGTVTVKEGYKLAEAAKTVTVEAKAGEGGEDQDLETAKKALADAIAAVTRDNEKVESEYTSETWTPFAAALEAAQNAEVDTLDADAINKLAKDLTEATTKLVKKIKITEIKIGEEKVNEDKKVTLTKGDKVETITAIIENFAGMELEDLSLVMTQSDVTDETVKEEIAKNHGKNFFGFKGKPEIKISEGTLTMTMKSGNVAATAGTFTFEFIAKVIEPITITVVVN